MSRLTSYDMRMIEQGSYAGANRKQDCNQLQAEIGRLKASAPCLTAAAIKGAEG